MKTHVKVDRTQTWFCPWCSTTVQVPIVLSVTNYQPTGPEGILRSTMVAVRSETVHHNCPGPRKDQET